MSVLYKAHPSMFRNRPLVFIILVLLPFGLLFSDDRITRNYGLIGLVVSPLLLLIWWLRCKTTTLTVTDRQISLRKGLISRDTNDIFIRDVRNVQIKQGPLQLLFRVGYVGISSSGQSGIEIEAHGLPSPDRIKKIIDSQKFDNPLL